MQTYEDKIKEFAQPMSNNSNKILIDTNDDSFLGITVKNDIGLINGLKGPSMITPLYIKEDHSLLINMKNIASEKEITIQIKLNDKYIDSVLVNLSNGLGTVDMYFASNDLKSLWRTKILENQTSRIALKRELEKAGLIK